MRRILDAISLALLVVIFIATGIALYGPNPLPDHIPTHFNAIGQADAWTTPSSYQILPVIAIVVYLALTVAAVYSSLAKQDPNSVPLFGTLALKLISAIKAELIGVFTCIQLSSLHTARTPDSPSSIWGAGAWILVAVLIATVAWFVTKIVRAQQELQTTSANS
jgi:uncharacterized membrane protein